MQKLSQMTIADLLYCIDILDTQTNKQKEKIKGGRIFYMHLAKTGSIKMTSMLAQLVYKHTIKSCVTISKQQHNNSLVLTRFLALK